MRTFPVYIALPTPELTRIVRVVIHRMYDDGVLVGGFDSKVDKSNWSI